MAIKGAEAKVKVAQKLAEAFGEDWIGEVEKKYYVWVKEGAERVQIAISLTCPKNMVGEAANSPVESTSGFPTVATNEITQDERDKISSMMAALGL